MLVGVYFVVHAESVLRNAYLLFLDRLAVCVPYWVGLARRLFLFVFLVQGLVGAGSSFPFLQLLQQVVLLPLGPHEVAVLEAGLLALYPPQPLL